MGSEDIELFFSQSYERDIDKLIRDDRNFIIPYEQLMNYVNNIISIPYKEYIDFLLAHPLSKEIEAKDITQSSSFSACEIEMCNALFFVDNPGLSYIEIGKLFPQYVSHPNEAAFRKYGENQIKTSAHLGLAYEYYKYWYLSCLGYIYPRLLESQRTKLLARTILRTPFYHRLMVDLCHSNVRLADYMGQLSQATQRRREGSVSRLLDICLGECKKENIPMHKLLNNITDTGHSVTYDLFNPYIDKAAEQSEESNVNTGETIKQSPNFDDEMVITISHLGFVERTPLSEIRSLTHVGDDNKAFYTRENDFVEYVSLATLHNTILFFTSFGRCYWLRVCDIPECNSNPNEYTVQNLLKIDPGDHIKAFILVEDYTDSDFLNSHYIVFCTKHGTVKKTCLMDYFPRKRPGLKSINAINICEEDALVDVVVTNGKNDLMLASREGRAIRFNESEVRSMVRAATGVRGMTLYDDKDEIVSIIQLNDVKTESVMVVCDNGCGIRTNLEDFRCTNRGSLGLKTMNVKNETEKVVAITMVNEDSDLIIFNTSGNIIRFKVKDIPIKKRATRCVKLIENFPTNDQIICVLKVDDFDKHLAE